MDDIFLHQSTISALHNLVLTHPTITYAVSKMTWFFQNPTGNHSIAVKCILRYLHGKLSFGLIIRCYSDLALDVYVNTEWVGCHDDG